METNPQKYEVVARRYRPQAFEALIGQEPILRTLRNAIESQRVGHAYLFTGSRGVGKTSAARIFAKCLNCERGASPEPCNQCESCLAVSTGDDMDVLEIDGASNRGIDEIRQLRANIGVRPSRSRYKIYIIDEVHMLSRDAFNALLKTLEEPPGHVKFIFCTTDVEKVPITVLSRCQRFDFAPIRTELIANRLEEIARQEGVEADPEAMWLLARRAEGSLRDSQSLLEQVLASTAERITESTIHQLLGTARHQQIHELVAALIARDAGRALTSVDQAIQEGVDTGQLCEQLLTLVRDVMVAAVGGSSDLMLSARAETLQELQDWGQAWGLTNIVSTLQILEHALSRMRTSFHRRALLEVAIVQVAHLDHLTDLFDIATRGAAAREATPPATANAEDKKKLAAEGSVGAPPQAAAPTTAPHIEIAQEKIPQSSFTPLDSADAAQQLWNDALTRLRGVTAALARECRRVQYEPPNRLIAVFDSSSHAERCGRPAALEEIRGALTECSGRNIQFSVQTDEAAPAVRPAISVVSQRERIFQSSQHPLVREAMELFDAEVTQVQDRRRS